jgi:transposase
VWRVACPVGEHLCKVRAARAFLAAINILRLVSLHVCGCQKAKRPRACFLMITRPTVALGNDSIGRCIRQGVGSTRAVGALFKNCVGRLFHHHRRMVEGMIFRYGAGIPWRDRLKSFSPGQSVWKRHRRFSGVGTWDAIFMRLLSQSDAAGLVGWEASVDVAVAPAHQHGTHLKRSTAGNFRTTRIFSPSPLTMQSSGQEAV